MCTAIALDALFTGFVLGVALSIACLLVTKLMPPGDREGSS